MTLPDELAKQGLALRRLAARLVGDPDAAEDVVQDAWVLAFERPPAKAGARGAWLRRVVRGLAVDALRARSRRRRVETPLGEAADPRRTDAARAIELQMVVLDAVRALPDPYRETVWQRFFEDRPPRDIAAAAGIPVKTVKTRLHRALGMLRQRLDAEHGGDQRAWAAPLLALVARRPLEAAATAAPPAVTSSLLPTMALWSLCMKSSAIRSFAAIAVLLGGLAVGWSLLGPAGGAELAPAPRSGAELSAALGAGDGEPAAVAVAENEKGANQAERRALGAAASGPSTGALAVRVLWHDRRPAASVGVSVRPSAPGRPRTVVAREATDADGRVLFEELEPGTVSVRTDRDSELELTVTAGATAEGEVVLERGVHVAGIVVRPDGSAVAGAGVWLQTGHVDWAAGRLVMRAGGDGRFVLPSVPPGASLGALAAPGGFDAPSRLIDLDVLEPVDGTMEVRLELGQRGGRLVGTVSALESGRPLGGARVAVGDRPSRLDYRGGRIIEQWSPRTVRTDDRGRFEVDGLPPGVLRFAAVLPGRGIVHGSVAIEPDRTVERDLALPLAATVFGHVRDGAGAALPDVSVFAYDREPGTSFVQGGQIDFDETFGHVGTVTGEDGAFRLTGVTPGAAHVVVQRAMPPRPSDRDSASGRAYVHEVLAVEPGAVVEWNPVLTDGRVIEGRALYRDGHPLAAKFVTLRAAGGGDDPTLVTDRDGRFRFVCLTEPLYHVFVQVLDKPRDAPLVEMTDVVPDRGPIEVRATFDRPAAEQPASVAGRVADEGGRITNPRAATVLLVTESNGWYTSRLDGDGRFAFERVDPGRLRLVVMDGETAVHHGESFEVAPAERHDVGTVTTNAAVAAVEVSLRRGEGTEHLEPLVSLRRADGRRGASVQPGGASAFTIGNLDPGEYEWNLYCQGAVPRSGAVTLRSAAAVALEIELIAGAPCKFDVRCADDAELGEVTLAFERGGVEFVRRTYRPDGAPEFRSYYVGSTLPPGEWLAVMTTSTGLRADARFTIRSVDDRPAPVLELR